MAAPRPAPRESDADYLDGALSDFSGEIAADELHDGPFCVLSIVDNRTFQRLSDQVLDRDPTSRHIEGKLARSSNGQPSLPSRSGDPGVAINLSWLRIVVK